MKNQNTLGANSTAHNNGARRAEKSHPNAKKSLQSASIEALIRQQKANTTHHGETPQAASTAAHKNTHGVGTGSPQVAKTRPTSALIANAHHTATTASGTSIFSPARDFLSLINPSAKGKQTPVKSSPQAPGMYARTRKVSDDILTMPSHHKHNALAQVEYSPRALKTKGVVGTPVRAMPLANEHSPAFKNMRIASPQGTSNASLSQTSVSTQPVQQRQQQHQQRHQQQQQQQQQQSNAQSNGDNTGKSPVSPGKTEDLRSSATSASNCQQSPELGAASNAREGQNGRSNELSQSQSHSSSSDTQSDSDSSAKAENSPVSLRALPGLEKTDSKTPHGHRIKSRVELLVEEEKSSHPVKASTAFEHIYLPNRRASRVLEQKQLSKIMTTEKSKYVLILCTGGTIAMVPTEDGLQVKKGYMEKYMRASEYFNDNAYALAHGCTEYIVTPESIYGKRTLYKIHELDEPIDSSNMTHGHYIKIAEIIEANYMSYDAFVVLHGTDTMAYTASFLTFMFENLTKPIVITGSMIPMSQQGNDAFNNLVAALTLAGHFYIPEVTIFMQHKLVRGVRATKVSSHSVDAFDSPNVPPIALFQKEFKVNEKLVRYPRPEDRSQPLRWTRIRHYSISILLFTPIFDEVQTRAILENPDVRGVVLLTYGAGNLPTNRPTLLNAIANAVKRGVFIVNRSQCFQSNVNAVYETGVHLQRLGVVFSIDMTVEATVAKMVYLMSIDGLTPEERNRRFLEDLRGEITPFEINQHQLQQQKARESKIQAQRRNELIKQRAVDDHAIAYSHARLKETYLIAQKRMSVMAVMPTSVQELDHE